MRTDELDFDLSEELIAQAPPAERTASRLMHYRRGECALAHRVFSDLPGILRAGDLLVFNDTRVLPARFALRKSTGGRIDGLFLEESARGRWRVLLRNLGNKPGETLVFVDAPELSARVIRIGSDGEYELQISSPEPAIAVLERIGRMPLPPYIRREKEHDQRDAADRERYQTVFAKHVGAVAAPTAALHFSQSLLEQLAARGIERTFVTLHVGVGTFKPVTAPTLEEHAMHAERFNISAEGAAALNRAKSEHRRIIAVGTTSARVLESQSPEGFASHEGTTQLLIHPPYQWRHVDALLTNFHLPRSTLIALVAAFVGLEAQRMLYRTAIDARYRFFSFGDAMLIE
jgi:S-adenosylmethionine:tRNA ribosyltransferase-isomerase